MVVAYLHKIELILECSSYVDEDWADLFCQD